MFARLFRPRKPEPVHPYARFFERFQPYTYPLPPAAPRDVARCEELLGTSLPEALKAIYTAQNGGYFGGGLLHLPGVCRATRHADLATWNQAHLWKSKYEDLPLDEYLFFAEDAFGNQFGVPKGDPEPGVFRFDIQHGEFTLMAATVGEFLNDRLVEEGAWLLGSDFRDEYQESIGDWQVGQHLAQVIPAMLGGAMNAENLRPIDPWINLHMCGQVVTKVKPLPPGTEVRGFAFHPDTLTLELNIISS